MLSGAGSAVAGRTSYDPRHEDVWDYGAAAGDARVLFFETIGVLKSPFFNIHITR